MLARERGLGARILAWEGEKPATGVEAAARLARYALLAGAAAEVGASHLLTAHSLEDQAETFLIRLGRGSGPFGLSAMRSMIDLGGVVLFRPFLAVPRARLAATAAAAGLVAHEDPMNADPRYERVRVRRLLPVLARAGLTASVLAATAARCARLAAEIDDAVDDLVASAVSVDAFAVVAVRRDAFIAAAAPVRERLLVRLLRAVGGGGYPPRSERLAALDLALSAADRPVRRTLAGSVIEAGPAVIRLWREVGRAGLPVLDVPPGFAGVWDGRYRVAIAADGPAGLSLGALGTERPGGWRRPGRLPAAAAAALPAFYATGRLVSVPALGWSAEGMAAVGPAVAECVSERILKPSPFPPLGPDD